MGAVNLHLTNAKGNLSARQAKLLRSALTRVEKRLRSLLVLDDLDLVVVHSKALTIPEVGVGGYTPHANLSFVYMDYDRSVSEIEIEATLMHELYHAARYLGPGIGRTLFDVLVFEGLAVAFERTMPSPGYLVRHVSRHRLDGRRVLHYMRHQLLSSDYNYHALFLNDATGTLPRWAGYALGYHLVRSYIDSTGRTAADLTLEPASILWPTPGTTSLVLV